MEIKLNIEASQMGETVVDLFNSISAKEKKTIAKQIMKSWLEEPYQIETNAHRAEALKQIMAGSSWDIAELKNLSEEKQLMHYKVTQKIKENPGVSV